MSRTFARISETMITGDTSNAVDPHSWLRAVRCGWVKKKEMYKVRSREAIPTYSTVISLAIPLT